MIFVTGTDTGVGKTVVSAALTLALDGYYWKPVQAGTEPSTDTLDVRRWTGLPDNRFLPEAYVLRAPMSPHAAAALDGVSIDLATVVDRRLPTDRPVVVEGAGGLLVPLHPEALIADLISALGLPVVVVARTSLGTLNHTLLTLAELGRREIPVAGVILNGAAHESNRAAIEHYGTAPVLGRIPTLESLSEVTLRKAISSIDIEHIL